MNKCKQQQGFILMGSIALLCVTVLILTAALLTYTRSIALVRRAQQLRNALEGAEMALFGAEPTNENFTFEENDAATGYGLRLKEVRVSDNASGKIILTLGRFETDTEE